jgi:hypothetical protein
MGEVVKRASGKARSVVKVAIGSDSKKEANTSIASIQLLFCRPMQLPKAVATCSAIDYGRHIMF